MWPQPEPEPVVQDTLLIDIISRDVEWIDTDEIGDIGAFAFCDCTKLTRIDLSKGDWVMIGESAFAGCYRLQAAVFPTLMVVDNLAFDSCSALTRVVFWDVAQGEPFVGDNVFYDTPIAQGEGYIYVPARRLAQAKELFWQYEDQVRAIEDGYLK